MLKKYIALGVALVLLLGLTACGGKEDKEPHKDSTTTVIVTTTTEGVSDGTTTVGDHGDTTTTAADTTTSIPKLTTITKKPTTTTKYVPDGVTVPIGTRPPTTTTTKKTTTTTTVAGGTTANGTTATTTAAPTTTTTTTVAKPTNPPANQHYIVLPEIGSDIDVTKKRNRIRVSAAYAWFNEDDTIGVSLTFTNYTTNWITQETDYVRYVCYDKDGKVVQRATKINLGVIDTKKYKSKTFEFTVPADTYEVRITESEIVYWTEWS